MILANASATTSSEKEEKESILMSQINCRTATKRSEEDTMQHAASTCSGRALCALMALLCCCLLRQTSEAAKLPDIYWNSSNPIFRIDNTDHIFDVNKKQNDHDQVDLVCPQPSNGNLSNPEQPERYIIYSVSKEEYDTCRLTGNPRVVALCDQTGGKNRPPFTVTFRPFTPQPNGLEFRAGQDYYFISALPGQPNDPKRFSPCRDLNMRVIFKVCCKSPSNPASPAPAPVQPVNTRAPLASLLPANYPTPSTRRPVMTLRPSLPSAGQKQQQQQQQTNQRNQPLEDYLRTLAPSPAPFGPQVPVTVLPIVVLQPSSSEAPQEAQESERNDIVQNEQQPISSTPSSTSRPHLPHLHQPQPPVPLGAPAQVRPVLRGFDPRLSPNQLLPRWQPTPLPASITQRRPEPAPQHLPPTRHDLYSHNIISWPASYDPSRAFSRDLTMMEPTSACASLRPPTSLLLLATVCLAAALSRYRHRYR